MIQHPLYAEEDSSKEAAQIKNLKSGFLANNGTADHVLTLRTLIGKYVNCDKTKVYACFVDFRKAFDSVWHDGLLYKVLQINVRANFYKVIKSLYSNSTCSIRIGNNQTQPFQYTTGVSQGCILSPLLFNLYVNDLLFHSTIFYLIRLCYQMAPNSILFFMLTTLLYYHDRN